MTLIKALAGSLALLALVAYSAWFFSVYPDQKRDCESGGGVMVRSASLENFHGYVCVDAKDSRASR